MAIKSTFFTGDNGKGFKIIIGDTIADRPVAANTSPVASEFYDLATGSIYKLKIAGTTKNWVLMGSPVGTITAMGGNTLVGGTKTVIPGPAITNNTIVIPIRTEAPGAGHAIGIFTVEKTNGVAGIGSFTVSSVSEAAGAVVATDVATFLYLVVEPS